MSSYRLGGLMVGYLFHLSTGGRWRSVVPACSAATRGKPTDAAIKPQDFYRRRSIICLWAILWISGQAALWTHVVARHVWWLCTWRVDEVVALVQWQPASNSSGRYRRTCMHELETTIGVGTKKLLIPMTDASMCDSRTRYQVE